jgi:L-2-hydroxyglutarate oxidase LhgO
VTESFDAAVIGGGIVGLATARALLAAAPARRVVVLERESGVGRHQSSHNSGVLHAGVYYTPGSVKATLCREGKAAMEAFCRDHGIPVLTTGKLVVAVDRSELERFDALVGRATANGVPGLRVLDADEMREIEPNVVGVRALLSPGTAAVDFGAVCEALAAELPDVRLGAEVQSIDERTDGVIVTTSATEVEAAVVVVCAGLDAERIATACGLQTDYRIVPFRGSWIPLRPNGAALVRGNIYPVPDPRLPFLGVHLTPRFDGQVWAGPNAVLSITHPQLIARAARFAGSWRLAARFWRVGAVELWRDRVRSAYIRQVQRYVPALAPDDFARAPRPYGIRAQAVDRSGKLVDDFVLLGAGRVVHALNTPSPAATSSLAIGRRLAAEAMTRW